MREGESEGGHMNSRIRTLSWAVAVTLAASCADSQQVASETQAASAATQRYIVKLTDAAGGRSAIARLGGQVVLDLPRHSAAAVLLPTEAAAALAASPHVAYVEPDPERHLQAQTTPYGIDMVQASALLGETPAGTITVCVIDSGIHPGHEDFAGIPMAGSEGALAWDVDGCGHGTHVAGTIAAANNDLGVVGVAPQAVSLHIVRVFGDGCSWEYASTLVAALDACRAAGASVVNMSLGGSSPSRTESAAFEAAWQEGVLSVAAAGNAGNRSKLYPASYPSVVSVAAIDRDMNLASFSQTNDQVELAAPGVGVLSTVPWTAHTYLQVGDATFDGNHMTGGAEGSASGPLVDGGLCTSSGDWAGAVVLCQRGENRFSAKRRNVTQGGGVAMVVYNNEEGNFLGTIGQREASIPAISLSQADGEAALAFVGQSATVRDEIDVPGSDYEEWQGTSMATPHVAGVAALIWSFHPQATAAQVRAAMTDTALDLGAEGRDIAFGFGLVQAVDALEHLAGLVGP
jgi:serine protease